METCMQNIKFTEVQCSQNLNKTLFKKNDGTIGKKTNCFLSNASCKIKDLPYHGFHKYLSSLSRNQAIIHGIPKDIPLEHMDNFRIKSKSNFNPTKGEITRTKANFIYPEGIPSLLMIDYDSEKGQKYTPPEEMINIIASIFPPIKTAAYVINYSSSAFIFENNTQCSGCSNSYHLYFFAKEGKDIPRFGTTLFKQLILKGFGYSLISKAGVILIRTLIDAAIFSPERVDFVAPSTCCSPLQQKKPVPVFKNGNFVDTKMLQSLTEAQEIEYKKIESRLKRESQSKALKVRQHYIETESKNLHKQYKNLPNEKIKSIIKNRLDRTLNDDDLLFFDEQGSVIVSEVLSNISQYDGLTLCDPLEPEKGRCKAKLYSNNGIPFINSFAGGGRKYQFKRFIKASYCEINEYTPLPLSRPNRQPTPYPLSALGDILSPAAEVMYKVLKAPDALCAHSLLSFASHAIQAHANVFLDGRIYPLNEFFLSIASRSSRKSECNSLAQKIHREKEIKLLQNHEENMENYKQAIELFENEKKKILSTRQNQIEKMKKLKNLRDNMPEQPYNPLLIFSDCTVEGIHKLFNTGTPSKILCADEGGMVSEGFSMKKDQKIHALTSYSKYWDGDSVDRIRSSDGFSVIRHCRLSIHLMMQDDIGIAFLNDRIANNQGFSSRFLVAQPASLVGHRKYIEEDISKKNAIRSYYSTIEKILNKPLPLKNCSKTGHKKNELNLREIRLDKDAKQCWIDKYNEIEIETKPDGKYGMIEGMAGKAANHIIRLSGIMALFENIDRKTIPRIYIENSIKLMEYYLDERLRLLNSNQTNTNLMEAQFLLDWLNKKGYDHICLPDIYRLGPNSIRNAKKARSLMKILESHYWITPIKPCLSPTDRRKSKECWKIFKQE